MNRYTLFLSSLILAPWLAAQEPPHDPVGENLFPPDLIMANQKVLGLDDTQKSAIRSEILKAQGRFTELQWDLQGAMETLGSLLKQTTVDEPRVLEQLDRVLQAERELKRGQISLMVRIKNKLTAEQQSKLRQMQAERKSR